MVSMVQLILKFMIHCTCNELNKIIIKQIHLHYSHLNLRQYLKVQMLRLYKYLFFSPKMEAERFD